MCNDILKKITREAILKANAAGLKHQNTGTYWSYYTPTLQIAYDCGQMGIDLSTCEDVTAWRHGDPPESYISTNYMDNKSERGLSCMAILGEREVGSAIFFRDRNKVTIKGLLLPYKGSDGEPLILCYDAPNYDN